MTSPEVRAPERASEAATADFLLGLQRRALTDRQAILDCAAALGLDLADGASVIVARAHPQVPVQEGWRTRVLAVAERGARAVNARSIATLSIRPGGRRSFTRNRVSRRAICPLSHS